MAADFSKVREVFLHAVGKLPSEQWDAYVVEACGGDIDLELQVKELLRLHREAGSFLDSPVDQARTIDVPENPECAGTVIGSYKLLQQIGEGGMGSVYMAEQSEPVRRRVALKLIKPGMDSRQVVARFEAERQALAIMDHPHIAQVFDGGTTPAGRPYFVMELVKGVQITEFCDENQYSPRQRLELFLQVCQAVQHAHQKGIIHRDLKPSNVLVSRHDSRPVVKVIDFGVAKALGQELTDKSLFTGIAQMIGTPLYMSPEQAGMSDLDVDTRSDIYSLGVLLYELLTGTTPFTKERFKRAAYDEIRRIIREEDPPRPSTRLSDSKDSLPSISAQRHMEPSKLTKLVRGELDWIVMKALEKDRGRRYATANAFAIDVQRFLADETVQACPPSARYRFRKFAKRNKAFLAATVASLLVVLLIVGGLIANNRLVTREKKKTEEALTSALLEKKRADQNLARARQAVRDYLATTANDPRLRSADFQGLRKNLLATAVPFFEEFAALHSDDPEAEGERGQAIFQLAYVREEMGETEKAREEYDRSRMIFAALVTAHPEVHKYREALAISCYNLGNVLDELYRPAEAQAAYNEALTVVERLLAEDDQPKYQQHLASVYLNLGTMFSGQKKHQEGADAYRRAAGILEKLVAASPTNIGYLSTLATARGNLASSLSELQQPDESLALHRQAIATRTQLVELDRTNRQFRDALANSKNNLGTLLEGRGDRVGATDAYREARELWAQLAADFRGVPDYRHKLAQSYFNRGNLLKRQDNPVEAIAAYRQAVSILETLSRDFPSHPLYQQHLGMDANSLGLLLLDNDQPAEAEAAFRTAIASEEKLVAAHAGTPEYAVTLGGNYVNLGIALREDRRAEASLEWFGKAIAILKPLAERKKPPSNAQWFLRNAHSSRANALVALKRYKESVSDWDRAVDLTPERERWGYRFARMDAQLRAGEHARATEEAEKAVKSEGASADTIYNAACILSLAAEAVGSDKVLADRYSARAMELLKAAISKGYTDAAHMKADPDLKSLRPRDDFKKLVTELATKGKK